MTRSFGRRGLELCALVGFLGFLAATGCTSSDVITSGGAAVELEGLPSPPDPSTFTLASFQVSQVHVRPTDPTANQVLGLVDANDPTKGIGLIQSAVPVDLKTPLGILMGEVVLSPGQYRGTQFKVNRIEVNTPTCSNDPARGCLQNSDCVAPGVCPATPTGAQCSGDVLTSLLVDPQLTVHFSASSLFVVPTEGQILLKLRVDADKFVQILKDHCVGNTFTDPTASEFETAGVFSLGE